MMTFFWHYKLFRSPLPGVHLRWFSGVFLRHKTPHVVKSTPSKHDLTPGGNVTTKIQWKRYEQVAKSMIQSYYQKGNDEPAKLMVTMGKAKILGQNWQVQREMMQSKFYLSWFSPTKMPEEWWRPYDLSFISWVNIQTRLEQQVVTIPQKRATSQFLESTELLGTSLLGN